MVARRASQWCLLSLLGASGCAPAYFLAPGERLVFRGPILRGHVLEETPPLYTHSNVRFFGLRVRLQLHWAGRILLENQGVPWRYLRSLPKLRYYTYALGRALRDQIGEPPAILSNRNIERDLRLLEDAYLQEGYFETVIQPQILPLTEREVQVTYRIRPGRRWYIRALDVVGADSEMVALVDSFWAHQKLPIGAPYRLAQLDALREATYTMLLSEGYYGLPLSQLIWEVDTTNIPEQGRHPHFFWERWFEAEAKPTCKVTLQLPSGYPRYAMGNHGISVRTPERTPAFWQHQANIPLYTEPRADRIIDSRLFVNRLYYPQSGRYDLRAIQTSQRAMQGLEVVQWVNPIFQADSLNRIHVTYDVLLRPPLDVMIGLEGFQSTQPLVGSLPLPGASANLRFTHLSLFRRGWPLRLRAQAALSYFRRRADELPLPLYNLAGEVALTLPQGTFSPRQAVPRPLTGTVSQFHTTLLLAYQDIEQVDFLRRYATFSWSHTTRYLLQDKRQEEQVWTPFSLTFIDSRFSRGFEAQIELLSPLVRSLILLDYLPRLTQVTAWQVASHRNYFVSQEKGNGDYSALLVELGGVAPFFLEHLLVLGWPSLDSTYRDNQLFNRFRYGVFVRFLLEGRWRQALLSPAQQLHLRGRLGIGQALYYTQDLPFENRFFVGGPNSMRAWQFGSLGPGRYAFPQNLFLIPGGTLLFEVNAELRQFLYKGIQVAPFIDVGNVWFVVSTLFEDARGIFQKNPYPAIGAGIGLRWDFSVLVIRLDIAQQVYNPSIGWVRQAFPIGGAHAQYIFAVGYPF